MLVFGVSILWMLQFLSWEDLVYGEKIVLVSRERPAQVLIGVGYGSQPMFPSLFAPSVLCPRVTEMPGQG